MLQRFSDELANDVEGKLVTIIETALIWSRAIADYRPSAVGAEPPGDIHIMHV